VSDARSILAKAMAFLISAHRYIYLIRRMMILATGLRQSRRAGIKFPMP
jgi:hypothetical protein